VRLGLVTALVIVIEFYVPEKFRKQSGQWIPPEQHGKIIPFRTLEKKSARHEGLRLRATTGSG
jgi:hypothetical protein